jgi:hypothetical protein
MLPLFAEVEWPSAIVGIVLIVGLMAIILVALFRNTIDDVLKLMGALGTLFGLVIGSMATYFFTNQAHQARTAQFQAEKQALVAQHQTAEAERDKWERAAMAAQEREKKAVEQASQKGSATTKNAPGSK